MWSIIFFASIIVVTFVISRNNYKKRSVTLRNNLDIFTKDIRDTFYSLSISNQDNFLNFLNPKDKSYFEALIANRITYTPNVWAIQQHMVYQEEIMMKLKSIQNS